MRRLSTGDPLKAAGGQDKVYNPLTVLTATQGSGKSTTMAHFSKEYLDYASFGKNY
jgi:hypothetical protein